MKQQEGKHALKKNDSQTKGSIPEKKGRNSFEFTTLGKHPYRFSKQHYLFLFACIAITIVCYIPSFTNDWTNWDDNEYVYQNALTKNLSFSALPKFFTTFEIGNYHPLAMLSLALDYMMFGNNAAGFHAHAVLLHLINVVL